MNANVELPTRPLALFALAVTGVFTCGAIGALTNAVNGAVSPQYFIANMGWQGVEDVWRASISRGIFEGLLFGVGFSLVFTVGVGLITRAGCTYGFAARHLTGIVAGALVCWVLGGVAALVLAAISPEFYRQTFNGVPQDFGGTLCYAWVGGSIWGVELGGFACTVIGLVVLRANWQRRAPSVDTDDTPDLERVADPFAIKAR